MYLETLEKMTSKMNKTDDAAVRRTAAFLADYASLLAGCGATCIRTEKNTLGIHLSKGFSYGCTQQPFYILLRICMGCHDKSL